MKVMVYPRLLLNVEGGDPSCSFATWGLGEDSFTPAHGYLSLAMQPMEVEVELPPTQEISSRCLALLRRQRDKLRAEHQAQLTKLQFLENQLLGLPSPEIVEADNPTRRPNRDVDSDDIPF